MDNHWGKDPNRQTGTPEYGPAPDLDEIINGAVRIGTGIGSTVLSGISYALDRVEEGLNSVRGSAKEQPFAHWKRKLDKRLQDKNQGEALALAITGWTLAACFGIAAVVMWALAAVGPQGLGVTQEEFLVFPILMACFTPLTVGFGIMGGVGVKKYRYISRLRRYLRGARDWVCEVSALAQASLLSREQVCKDLQQAVANGDLPNALLEDGKLYLDLERCAPEETPAPQEPAQTEPARDEAECFRREGAAFLEDLRRCSGKLSADAEEELVQMQKSARPSSALCITTLNSCPGCGGCGNITCPPRASCWTQHRGWGRQTAPMRRKSAGISPASCIHSTRPTASCMIRCCRT